MCQDGVRKKAKYLHDAPAEALRPVLGLNYKANYNPANHPRSNTNRHSILRANSGTSTSTRIGTAGLFPSEKTAPYAPLFSNQQASMRPPLQARAPVISSQQSPISSPFSHQESLQNISLSHTSSGNRNSFNSAIFDPNNPALFNFDLEGLNFGNHYGALEFGMLGHMSSGVADISSKDQTGPVTTPQGLGVINLDGNGVYGNGLDYYNQIYSNDLINCGNMAENQTFSAHHNVPSGYAITCNSQSQYSPMTENSPVAGGGGYENSPPTGTASHTPNSMPQNLPTPKSLKTTKSYSAGAAIETSSGISSCSGFSQNPRERSRDPSYIYEVVKEPYSYTTGFHKLTAFLQFRFPPAATLRIAKSLASIRPSFMSCTKSLNRQDLIFMEKCFQRTLFEYEEFMHNCCTPTIVCRRTGEIAAVNQEFSMMTGWRREVLLGKVPNLNVNMGKQASENVVGGTRRGHSSHSRAMASGLITPEAHENKSGKLQPVFLAELLDDDSVIEFYQDFARLAFNDSRGSVMTRCKLLKYCTGDKNKELNRVPSPKLENNEDCVHDRSEKITGKRKGDSAPGESGGLGKRLCENNGKNVIGNLERDGKLDCSYCWTIKRDVFDIPMLIVMNVSLFIGSIVTYYAVAHSF